MTIPLPGSYTATESGQLLVWLSCNLEMTPTDGNVMTFTLLDNGAVVDTWTADGIQPETLLQRYGSINRTTVVMGADGAVHTFALSVDNSLNVAATVRAGNLRLAAIEMSAEEEPPPQVFPATRNPIVWLDASHGVRTDGAGGVLAWLARGSGGAVFVPTLGQSPTLQLSDPTLGGQPTIAAGSGQAVRFTPPPDFWTQPNTIYVVGYTSVVGAGGFVSGSNLTQLVAFTTAGLLYSSAGTNLTSTFTSLTPHALCGVFNGTESALYIDSSDSPAVSGDAGPNNAAGPTINIASAAAAAAQTVVVGTIIVVPGADSPEQVREMFEYLGALYDKPWPTPPFSRDPVIWLDPAYGITTDESGGVTQWAARGSAGVVLTPHTATRPVFLASDPALNSQPAIRSDFATGGTQGLQAAFGVAQPLTIYVVGLMGGIAGQFVFGDVFFLSAPLRVELRRPGLPSRWSMSASNTLYLDDFAAPTDLPHAFCAVFNGASSAFYIDNSSVPAVSGNPGTSGLSATVAFVRVGTTPAITTQGCTVIIPGADTAEQRARMFRYLGDLYSFPWS